MRAQNGARGDQVDAGEEAAEAAEQTLTRLAPMPVTPPSADELRRELADQQSGDSSGNQ